MSTVSAPAPSIDVSGLQQLLREDRGAAVVDVRTAGEYAGVHIDGSHNIPLDVLRGRADEVVAALPGRVALLCGSGPRAEEAAGVLRSHGATDVQVFEGGMRAWEAGGNQVVRGKGTWAMDRQVRLAAGSLALAGVLASTKVAPAKWLAAGIGAGLTFSALTNTCGMTRVLGLLPYNRRSGSFDADAAISGLRTA